MRARRRLSFGTGSCGRSDAGFRCDPENPFSVYFPKDSCSSLSDVSTSVFNDSATSSVDFQGPLPLAEDVDEQSPEMLATVVNLRQVHLV